MSTRPTAPRKPRTTEALFPRRRRPSRANDLDQCPVCKTRPLSSHHEVTQTRKARIKKDTEGPWTRPQMASLIGGVDSKLTVATTACGAEQCTWPNNTFTTEVQTSSKKGGLFDGRHRQNFMRCSSYQNYNAAIASKSTSTPMAPTSPLSPSRAPTSLKMPRGM